MKKHPMKKNHDEEKPLMKNIMKKRKEDVSL